MLQKTIAPSEIKMVKRNTMKVRTDVWHETSFDCHVYSDVSNITIME
jgi:hypothetical protein